MISIHAPVWGATNALTNALKSSGISIHAPVWGATQMLSIPMFSAHISIHAPVWGATARLPLNVCACEFQSTRPCGARQIKDYGDIIPVSFQSTRPCGARRNQLDAPLQTLFISIHAPVWGATYRTVLKLLYHTDFNPRARVGRDDLSIKVDHDKKISIHAPVWGATMPVYTGLITAVALYFSRTSFLAVLLQAFFVAKSSV